MASEVSEAIQSVARWMVSEYEKRKELRQRDAVQGIKSQFGEEFTMINNNGNLAIIPTVLAEFCRLKPDIVWETDTFRWRERTEKDDPNSRAAKRPPRLVIRLDPLAE